MWLRFDQHDFNPTLLKTNLWPSYTTDHIALTNVAVGLIGSYPPVSRWVTSITTLAAHLAGHQRQSEGGGRSYSAEGSRGRDPARVLWPEGPYNSNPTYHLDRDNMTKIIGRHNLQVWRVLCCRTKAMN